MGMTQHLLTYHFSPGFMGDPVIKNLSVDDSFRYRIHFFWYIRQDYFPESDAGRMQIRRYSSVADRLPQQLIRRLNEIIFSDIKIIEPEPVITDPPVYASSTHYKSEFYRLKFRNEEFVVHVPYDISGIRIEGKDKDLFLNFHNILQEWIEEQFEMLSEGKSVRYKKT